MLEDNLKEDIIRNIRVKMREKNMKQKELADAAGITECAMIKYMKHKRIPNTISIIKIATALNCTTDDLLMKRKDDGFGTMDAL